MSTLFEVVLPVSGRRVSMRRATLRDERLVDLEYALPPAGSSEADRAALREARERAGEKPWALIARTVAKLDGEPVTWKVDDILELPTADASALLLFYRGLNALTNRAVEEIEGFFARPDGSGKRSCDLSSASLERSSKG